MRTTKGFQSHCQHIYSSQFRGQVFYRLSRSHREVDSSLVPYFACKQQRKQEDVLCNVKELLDKGFVDAESEAKGIRRAFEVCGLEESIEIDEKAGGSAYKSI